MVQITKTDYVEGLQCSKLFHHRINKLEIPPLDISTRYSQEQGKFVGDNARKVYPDGVYAGADNEYNLRTTAKLMQERRVIFEAGVAADFKGEQLYSRADILVPNDDGSWNIIEVKSATSEDKVEKKFVPDVAFQVYCWRKAGFNIRNVLLMHPDKDYVRHGEIDFKKIFLLDDVTTLAEEHLTGIEASLDQLVQAAQGSEPKVLIHNRCDKTAYTDKCPLIKSCWDFLPEGNVFDLRSAYGKDFKVLAQAANKGLEEALKDGSLLLKNMPKTKFNDFQMIQWRCAQDNSIYVNPEGIRMFLGSLKEPLYFFDMETFTTWLPFFDNSRPYQHIPFQYSLDVVRGDSVVQHSFLAEGLDDPRIPFLASLEEILGPNAEPGSVIVYYQHFEKPRMREMARDFPEHAEWIHRAFGYKDEAGEEADPGWVVDLMQPFAAPQYYNPSQKGSVSLKYVLPAVTGKNYKDLAIDNGALASLLWLQMFRRRLAGENVEKEYAELRQNLLQYCGQDTEGPVEVLKALKKMAA